MGEAEATGTIDLRIVQSLYSYTIGMTMTVGNPGKWRGHWSTRELLRPETESQLSIDRHLIKVRVHAERCGDDLRMRRF